MEPNPYASPSANLYGPSALTSQETVAPSTISHLQRTKPWVRLISVLLGIFAALTLLGAVGMLITSGVFMSSGRGPANGVFVVVGSILYFLLGFLYLYPARRLGFYARNIRKLMDSRASSDLAAALKEQRRFWKFQGIMTIVMFAIWVLAILSALLISPSHADMSR